MIKRYNEFLKINESGIPGIKNVVKGYSKAEIFFHMDDDGVMSALAMKEYLRRYGVETIDAHIIQYGGTAYAVKHAREGSLPVLVDFAHSKPTFKIHTDHHDNQAGVVTKATSFKSARSNAQTLSAEVSPSDIFTQTDLDSINTVDSADFLRNNITPEMVSNSIFKVDKEKSGSENRYMMGFVVNRLLLAYKNKAISGTSLDGKRQHVDKGFLECMVLDCSPSLYSMYVNIKHYIKNFTWSNAKGKQGLATPEELADNLFKYQETMKTYKNLEVDEENKIAVQYGGGSMIKPGSYDRYTIFKNYPDINFYSIVWPIGLVQVSCNPFKEKELANIHLGDIAKEVMEPYKRALSQTWITVGNVKKEAEMDMENIHKKAEKGGKEFQERVGFKFEDLKAFYSDKTFRATKDGKRDFKVDLDDKYQSAMRSIMDKRHSELSWKQKNILDMYKISAWDLIMGNSGGHPSITNLQGWNHLKYASPVGKTYLEESFGGSSKYVDVMKFVQAKFIETLKVKVKEANLQNV